jgi:16S rRNA (cytosine1402-N4)-methyltransferase
MHEPVMLEDVLRCLAVRPGGIYIDGTSGSGGHSAAIAERMGSGGRLLSMDRDPEALERTRMRMPVGKRTGWITMRGEFGDMLRIAHRQGISEADGVLLDLGVSSEQLDTPARGFSFQTDGPLDMRMDPCGGQTAADLVAGLGAGELAELIRTLGEEPNARRIARAIVRERERAPVLTTGRLAEIVARCVGGAHAARHPATRTFQALRMAVNDEAGELRRGLEQGLSLLRTGGRLAVMTFHSLDDREVKGFFRAHVGREEALQGGGSRFVCERPPVRLVTRKPITPGEAERSRNSRARSAKLRAVERIEFPGDRSPESVSGPGPAT